MKKDAKPLETVPQSVPQATGLRRLFYVACGAICVGLAYLGVALPGLPTTPWVLLASWFFCRSSPRLERWLLRSPIFGALIRDWQEHRGIRRPVKMLAICLIFVAISLSILSGRLPIWAQWAAGICAACGVCTILFVVLTIRPHPVSSDDPN